MKYLVSFPGLGLEFTVNRVAFTIGGLSIYWYGVLIALGLTLALVFAFRHCLEFGVDPDAFVDAVVIGTVMAILCARIYYVAMAPFEYDSIWEMLDIREGGLAIYGGIIGAVIFGGLACKWRKLPVLATFDLVGMGFLIGQCIGRWGNFVNQEAFGYNTTLPWGMYSAVTEAYLRSSNVTLPAGMVVDPTQPVHPTFLYESLWCITGFIILRICMKKRRFNGDLALRYAIWYGLGRFWIEGLRTDSLLLVPSIGLRVSQLVAAVAVVAGVAAEIVLTRRANGRALMVRIAVSADNRKLEKGLDAETVERIENETEGCEAYAELPRSEFIARTAAYNAALSEALKAAHEAQ